MSLIHKLIGPYKLFRFARIEAIVCLWLLIISLAVPNPALAFFAPELWKPIFPFQFIALTEQLLLVAIIAWRLSLVTCILLPGRRLPLLTALAITTFCLGLCNCFWLEIQLFAPLELTLILLLSVAVLLREEGERAPAAAFASSHLAEVFVSLALFSKRASRYLIWFFLIFVLVSLIAFGINFLSIVPLLIICLVWNVCAQKKTTGRL